MASPAPSCAGLLRIGERIAGELTVTGYLCAGRLGHLYLVWSLREWCAQACKILAPDLRGDRRAVAARRLDLVRRPSPPLGTAPYMAPEHARGLAPGPAADVYGLGALLYELVTGRWPFQHLYGREDDRTGKERQFPQITGELPPPPRRFNARIPASLERTILRCLHPAPEQRFDGPQQLVRALADELGEPLAFSPEAADPGRRRRGDRTCQSVAR